MRYLTVVLVTIACLLVASTVLAADYVLITHKSNPVTSLSAQDAKNYYLGKQTTWSNGTKVTVYTQSSSPIHTTFLKQIVRKSPQQYTTYWKKSLFTGTGLPPKDFAGDDEMKKAVAAQPGSLGYISANALDGSVKKVDVN